MGDLFDEFMRELERRRAEAEGRTPPRDPADPEAPAGDDDRPGTQVPPDDSSVDRPAGDTPDEGAHGRVRRAHPDPPPLPDARQGRRGRRPAHTPRAKQPVGGPDDGAGRLTLRTILRRVGLVVAIVLVAFIVFLAGTGHRPVDRCDLVRERRLRQRLLDPHRRPGGPVLRHPGRRADRAPVQPLSRRAPGAPARSREAGPAPPGGGPPDRGPAPGGALGAHGWRPRTTGRRPVPRSRPGRRARRLLRPGRHPGPRADREVGHRGRGDRARHRDRRRRVRHLDHGAAVDQPRPVLARRGRGRPGLRARHQLLPVRPAVPPLRPVAAQRPAAGRAAGGGRAVPGAGHRGRRGLQHAGPRPSRGDRRPVPPVGRVRLPAGQVRARVQHRGRRHGRLLHRRERPLPGL